MLLHLISSLLKSQNNIIIESLTEKLWNILYLMLKATTGFDELLVVIGL